MSRKVVFVVGSGRSGTSTVAGTLQTLGMYVPQPEVASDESNPKGFGEPQWVVDLHDELLRRSLVAVSDARPGAWLEAGKVGSDEELRGRVSAWLEEQLAHAEKSGSGGTGEVVVKDPRLAWFLGLWRAAAIRCDATPSYVTMLRPVPEVVGSKQRYYAGPTGTSSKAGEISRTAAWVNMMLHTERSTRGEPRLFVRYGDLLEDWTVPVSDIGQRFGLASVQRAHANDIRAVHAFIDPGLRRVQLTWDDVTVPAALRELAEASWAELDALAGSGGADADGDTAERHATLDELRTAYAELYAAAEAVASSTTVAQRRRALGERPEVEPVETRPQGLDKLDHRVRAMVPASARRAARKALGRERPE